MTRVTITVETDDKTLEVEETADTDMVLPLLFRAAHAVIVARPNEIQVITQAITAVRVLCDAMGAAAAPRPEPAETSAGQL